MEKNIGPVDKAIRILSAAMVGLLILSEVIPDSMNLIVALPASIFLVTGFASFCPLYVAFGLSSRKDNN